MTIMTNSRNLVLFKRVSTSSIGGAIHDEQTKAAGLQPVDMETTGD